MSENPLSEIRARRAERYDADQTTLRNWADIDWLVGEVKRLEELADERGREIARLWEDLKAAWDDLEAAGLHPSTTNPKATMRMIPPPG